MTGTLNPKLEFNPYTVLDFVEFSFCLPVFDLFYLKWEDNLTKSGKELKEICQILKIEIDVEFIESEYWKEDNNNVFIFHSKTSVNNFILLDLLKDDYDQCNMITIAVRVHKDFDIIIRDLLLTLYKKSSPRSNFQIDYFNNHYYRQVFHSSFYFYQQKIELNRKQLHFGL